MIQTQESASETYGILKSLYTDQDFHCVQNF